MSIDLVIMAAGMGSRYGGLKQAAPIGPNGEMIIDFSVSDAVRAGFNRAVIIIRRDIEQDFRAACGRRIEKLTDVEYVYQEKEGMPEGRTKPWGTGHAILCTKDVVKGAFAVINADDYYGQSVYKTMYNHLSTSDEMCMAGYKLGNTLSENGTVSRGVCSAENGYLSSIEEITAIDKSTSLSMDTIVSMNMWGLNSDIFPFMEKEFEKFLEEHGTELKSEFFLPSVINNRMNFEGKKVRVLETPEQWYGVTYPEDTEHVKKAIAEMFEKGLY